VRIIVLSLISIIYISFSVPLISLFKKQLMNSLEKRRIRIEEEEFGNKKSLLKEKLNPKEEDNKNALKENNIIEEGEDHCLEGSPINEVKNDNK
jgi:hypothetical protein